MNSSTWRPLARASRFLILLVLLASTCLVTRADQGSGAPAAEYQPRAYLPLIILGSGAATPNNPVAVRFVDDVGRAAHAAIGPEGGTFSATAADGTRFELSVPAEALDFSETITMTPVLRSEKLPLSGGLIGAVNLEPAGLTFYEPATLRIMPAALAPGFETIGFAYNGSGEQFHLRPLVPSAGSVQLQATEIAISMEIVSIRPVGAGRGSQADIDRQLAQTPPDDPLDASEQRLADTKIVAEAQLEADYQALVLPALQRAETDDQLVDQAIARFDQWLTWVDAFGVRPHFITQFAEAKTKIAHILQEASAAAADRCYTQKRPEEGFRMLRWLRYARKYVSNADIAAIEARLAKCLQFKLAFHSKISALTKGQGYIYELEAEVILRAAKSTRATGTAALEWVDFRWVGDTSPCSFITQGSGSTFNAAEPAFGLSLVPVSRMSPAVNVTLRYDPGKPLEHLTIQCPNGTTSQPPASAWSTYFTSLHQYEFDSTGINTTVQIVNVGSFTGWVYHHTGGPNGEVVEDTQIDLAHVPER